MSGQFPQGFAPGARMSPHRGLSFLFWTPLQIEGKHERTYGGIKKGLQVKPCNPLKFPPGGEGIETPFGMRARRDPGDNGFFL